MSVIFGIKEKEVIFVAGDKRASDIDGALRWGGMEKVGGIEDGLCLALA